MKSRAGRKEEDSWALNFASRLALAKNDPNHAQKNLKDIYVAHSIFLGKLDLKDKHHSKPSRV